MTTSVNPNQSTGQPVSGKACGLFYLASIFEYFAFPRVDFAAGPGTSLLPRFFLHDGFRSGAQMLHVEHRIAERDTLIALLRLLDKRAPLAGTLYRVSIF